MEKNNNKHFTMGSLFDGSGAFPFAATLCGITPVWASEIEPFPIRVTRARFPKMKHYGDISQINGADLEPVDLVTGGSPCFVAGTLIQTDIGLIPIEEVKVGDKVLTHTNTYKKVEKTGGKKSDSIIKIKMMGSPDITTTENHPFYVRKSKRDYSHYIDNDGQKKRHNNKGMMKPEWMPAEELKKGYYVGFSINTEEKNERKLTKCECYLIGRYIADGYINESHRSNRENSYNHKVIFCIGKNKLDDFIKNVHDYHVCRKEQITATKCEIISQRLVDLCKECGKGAINKTIPQFVMDLPPELLKSVIDGYMSGDGSHSDCYKATTISKNLAYQLQQAIAKVYHTYAKIYFSKRPETCVIERRTVNQHDTYAVNFQKEARKQDKYIYQDGMIWVPFARSEKSDIPENVYNLQVAEDNSYTAYNFTVHNCQSLSVAGKRDGMSKKCVKCGHLVLATEESDICPECGGVMAYTRSGLFMEQIRIIKEMREKSGRTDDNIRPRFMLWENVVGAFSSNEGEDFRAVLEETARIAEPDAIIPRPEKGKWNKAGCIMGDGFSIAWRVLDAQYWGVPQRRRRIALVADFNGGGAGEILFEREGLRRNFTESCKSWQGIVGGTSESVGETGSQYAVDFDRTADRIQMNADKATTLLGLGGGAGAKTGLYCLPKAYYMNERQYALTVGDDVANTLTGTDYKGTQCIFEPVILDDQGGSVMQVSENVVPTLRAEVHGNVPIICNQPKCYGIGGYNSEGMKSDNPKSGFYEADTSRTLDLNGGNPSCNQGGIAVCEPVYAFEPGIAKRDGKDNRFSEDVCPTLRANMGDNQSSVAYSLQGNMIGREDHNGPQGSGINEDVAFTLNTTDRHAVCFRNSGFADYVSSSSSSSTLKAAGGDFGGGSETLVAEKEAYRMEAFGQYSETDKASTMKSRDYKDATDLILEPEYIVRRLTPLECSRLQGMPDWWTDGLQNNNPTDEDMQFWREVFETHRKVVTGASKPKTDKQIKKWLAEKPSDGALYKMWGNGIALPCFLYVMEGVQEELERK